MHYTKNSRELLINRSKCMLAICHARQLENGDATRRDLLVSADWCLMYIPLLVNLPFELDVAQVRSGCTPKHRACRMNEELSVQSDVQPTTSAQQQEVRMRTRAWLAERTHDASSVTLRSVSVHFSYLCTKCAVGGKPERGRARFRTPP